MLHPKQYTNEHGVLCRSFTTGPYFMAVVGLGEDEELIYETNAHVEVPECCVSCDHFEVDYGEFMTQLSPPYCCLNIWFPRKKGTCKKRKPVYG